MYDAASGRAMLQAPPTPARQYTDAQLDDYHAPRAGGRRARLRFAHRPPLRLSLRARASHAAPAGTLGFGFWNEPFSVLGAIGGTPNVAWFFYAAPPSDMVLAPGVPGRGWKAATLYTGRLPGWLVGPPALAAMALARVPGLGRPILSLGRRFVTAYEALLDDVALDAWREYVLEWRPREARFWVDGVERLRSPAPPVGPLGLVIWIDNQYAVASLDGRLGFGVTPLAEAQTLEIEGLRLEPLV